jgi:hypothetical protein
MGHSDLLFIRPNRVVRLFVWSDVITFWIQGSGGSFSAIQGNPTFQTVGKYVSCTLRNPPLHKMMTAGKNTFIGCPWWFSFTMCIIWTVPCVACRFWTSSVSCNPFDLPYARLKAFWLTGAFVEKYKNREWVQQNVSVSRASCISYPDFTARSRKALRGAFCPAMEVFLDPDVPILGGDFGRSILRQRYASCQRNYTESCYNPDPLCLPRHRVQSGLHGIYTNA